jgi:hypothetical protein
MLFNSEHHDTFANLGVETLYVSICMEDFEPTIINPFAMDLLKVEQELQSAFLTQAT